jgi:hypothetical protein
MYIHIYSGTIHNDFGMQFNLTDVININTKVVQKVKNVLPYKDIYW